MSGDVLLPKRRGLRLFFELLIVAGEKNVRENVTFYIASAKVTGSSGGATIAIA